MATNAQQSIYSELADFLVSQPTLEALADYKVPTEIQQYIDELIEKNNKGVLSTDERLELERILTLSHIMTLAKTKARLKLAGKDMSELESGFLESWHEAMTGNTRPLSDLWEELDAE